MGVPYSRQIKAAFDEVTPLVAAGFQVLRTSRNISILLAFIQILNTLFLGLAVLVLIAILLTVNPDLELERRIFVTPTVKWLASWLLDSSWLRVGIRTMVIGAGLGAFSAWYLVPDSPALQDLMEEGDDDKTGVDGDVES